MSPTEQLHRDLIRRILSDARWAMQQSRRYSLRRDYWQGMARGHMHTARHLAHVLLGHRWCNARTHLQEQRILSTHTHTHTPVNTVNTVNTVPPTPTTH